MIEVSYQNLKDRAKKVKENEAKGLSMVSDTFDSGWKRGEEPHGVMVFTDDQPAPVEKPRNLAAEIDEILERLEKAGI